MKAEYKRDMKQNLLVLRTEKGNESFGYELQMLRQNPVEGLLSFDTVRMDGVLYFHYEITAKQPILGIYEKKQMNHVDILRIFSGIQDILEEMQKYLLSPGGLLFDPQYMYMCSNTGRLLMCYFPEDTPEHSITNLAEFILKRLDHEERQAVELGYRFYQQCTDENFSLSAVIKDYLEGYLRNVRPIHRKKEQEEETQENRKENTDEETSVSNPYEEAYTVVHKDRRNTDSSKKITGRLFQMIHPAVLGSMIFFSAVLAVVFWFGFLHLTETGGLFFLMLSVELLINKAWRHAGKRKAEAIWEEDGTEEAYEELQEEMYRMRTKNAEGKDTGGAEPIEETQLLTADPEGLRLIPEARQYGSRDGLCPEIMPGNAPLYIGKRAGDADIILHSPAVSRIHARVMCREGMYFVKDMNSRNGTFCNGRKLHPQEEREITEGDQITFADIRYYAVQGKKASIGIEVQEKERIVWK